MNKLGLFKDAVDVVVSIGVSSIVGGMIKKTIDTDSKLPKKIVIGIGGFVLSHMVADMASKYAEEKIDSTVDSVNKVVSTMKRIKQGIHEIPSDHETTSDISEEE